MPPASPPPSPVHQIHILELFWSAAGLAVGALYVAVAFMVVLLAYACIVLVKDSCAPKRPTAPVERPSDDRMVALRRTQDAARGVE